ncbi:DegT/DnrJ/EryC1/StrS aminotransferase family protein [Nonomuraea sp. NEAU-A123]|uniref:DegT/DnrJ/EryC1/StrS family aminotransferase n=1 Tax=Nonomuraea sp. NEAU-A123 TaxID=2839649 RepID=UPI001BE455F3|nr:DegT/DnrJ/EryC1/StrS family aminotransferase [Nonomuraea sp. NEAU-A123]MBT2227207.1 DegT/DnrJ/EryC1/StrS family aminotransferase [Nonomuraea sp. NEAU-A123]
MTLALHGGAPVRSAPWPAWPPPLDPAQRALVTEVLESGRWGATQGGSAVTDLAAAFARRSGVPYGVAVGNATLGLFAALRGLGVGRGDEVIVPAYTFVASATAVLLAGATPVIADVNPVDLHLSPEAVEAALTGRTAAIMPVHLAGSPADMDPLNALAARHGLVVVEDAAQAHGATYKDRPIGGLGDAGVYSFQASKAMTAGEGGLIVCRDEAAYEAIWSVCNLGRKRGGQWYGHPTIGWNLRLTEIQAALLLPWLDRLDTEIDRRESFCTAAEHALTEHALTEHALTAESRVTHGGEPVGVRLPYGRELPVSVVPQPPGTTRDSRHLLMLRVHVPVDREFLLAAMAAEGVPLDAGYPPLGTFEALAQEGARAEPCPAAEAAAREVVWVRQSMLMDDPRHAVHLAEALAKVLAAMPPRDQA